MSEHLFFWYLIAGWFILAGVTFVLLFFVAAPYGRHTRTGWGPAIGSKVGWLVMEAPAALVFAAWFWVGERYTVMSFVFLGLWEAHYLHRAFIYPLTLRETTKQMPISVIGLALLFNTINAYLNGRYLFTLSDAYPVSWLVDPRFLVGLALYVVGYAINRHADRILRHLRGTGEAGYKIPRGGLYRWVSCPNYLGEIVEWFGWAIATWSLPGLAFAVWTAANLVPRAWTHHRWYREHFAEYPEERKALVPGLW